MAQLPFLLERAKTEGTPLLDGRLTRNGAPFVSSRGEHQVTFVWRGKNPPVLTGDFVHWATDKRDSWGTPYYLKKVEPNVWAYSLTFPRGAYVEYDFMRNGKRVGDRYNARRTPNGIGDTNNYFYVPPGEPSPLLKSSRTVPHGQTTTYTLVVGPMIYGYQRKIHLYQPPTDRPAALLVALDGKDYLRRAKLPILLDNLFAQGKIPPVAAVMVETTPAAKGSARTSENAMNEATLIFLLRHVVPFAQKNLNLLNPKKSPGAYGVMGASISGLMAFFTALRAPQTFGKVISQAGSFDLWGSPTGIYPLIEQAQVKPRVWLDVGEMDFLLGTNRQMFKRLKRLNYDVKYREYYTYHNWVGWRNSLPEALTWAFGND